MSRLVRRRAIALWLFVPVAVFGTTHRVPQDFPTIQLALAAMGNGDTVLVSPGVYAETLEVPAHVNFVLRGDVNPDSLGTDRPVVDPSSLPNSDELNCLTLRGIPVVEDFVFRNGPAMYAGRPEGLVGGVNMDSTSRCTFRRCRFDSVYYALGTAGYPTLEQCEFCDVGFRAIENYWLPVVASDCCFSGDAWPLIRAGSHSDFERCVFSGITLGREYLWAQGSDLLFRECVFGPDTLTVQPVLVTSRGPTEFRNNLMSGLRSDVAGLFQIDSDCRGDITIAGNVMTNCSRVWAFSISCPTDEQGNNTGGAIGRLDSNLIADNSYGDQTRVFSLFGNASLYRNRFDSTTGSGALCFQVWDTAGGVHSLLRDNIFLDNGYAVGGQRRVDARWNYWGDATGPYQPLSNPEGQGDQVGDSVLFDPWYADTSFLSVPGLGRPLPEEFTLEAYPNPFNSSIHFTLLPSQVRIVKLELFDILGRRAGEIWRGPLAFQKDISFDASALATGIYFARVSNAIDRKTLAAVKVVLLK